MKKLKILRNEVKVQMILSAIAIIVCLFVLAMEGDDASIFTFLICLFFIGVFNIIGFIIRLFLVNHKLNWIYLVSVIVYFALFYVLNSVLYVRDEDMMIFLGGTIAVFLNGFYIWYGDYIVKNWVESSSII